jgi:hypothetical protein
MEVPAQMRGAIFGAEMVQFHLGQEIAGQN